MIVISEPVMLYRVENDNMLNDRIMIGDTVIIDIQIKDIVNSNRIALVYSDSLTTLARLFNNNGKYIMKFSSPYVNDLECDDYHVIGMVKEILIYF